MTSASFLFEFSRSSVTRRRGLTLLELLVVLTILIALGGIVVSSLPGLLDRTQTATAAANVPAINEALRRSILLNQGRMGDGFDSLVAGSGVAPYVGGAEAFQTTTLSDGDRVALAELGITSLVPAREAPENATFSSHDQQPVPLTQDSSVCMVSPSNAEELMRRLWNLETDESVRYLVFGLGQKCGLVGAGPDAVFSETPLHFSDNTQSSPKNMYSRYLVIVELKSLDDRVSRARYLGTAIPDQTGLLGIEDQLNGFYSSQ